MNGGIFVEANIRKLENNLVTIGTGVVILSLWTLLKNILYMFVYQEEIEKESSTLQPIETVFVIGLIAAGVVVLVLHCFIGMSAIDEGKGKRKHPVYLFVTGFIIIFYAAMILLELLLLFFNKDFSLKLAVSMVIDVTTIGLMIDILTSSLRLRKLKKQKAEKEESTV